MRCEIAKDQGRKILVLARDIVEAGLNPADLPIVMRLKGDGNRYVVLEGNRRLASLKALENPEALVGAVDPVVLAAMRKLGAKYQQEPIESVQCLVVKNRNEARHWIELRHTGENEGAGIVRWGSDEASRFRARTGNKEIHLQALDFLEKTGHLTPETRRSVPVTSFKRLLGTPAVRDKLGVTLQSGQLKLVADEKRVAKALAYVADDLASGKTKTEKIYTLGDRVRYAKTIPQNIAVKPTLKNGRGLEAGDAVRIKHKRSIKSKKRKRRDNLIPGDCTLSITDPRTSEIEGELRTLSLEDYTNAISVLFRVFLELSADAYISQQGLSVHDDATLSNKLTSVVDDLLKHAETHQEPSGSRSSCLPKRLIFGTIDQVDAPIHPQQACISCASDLRAHWNSLQPFVVAIWSP